MSPAEYRQHAAQCVAAIELVLDNRSKQLLLEMAAAWLRLADQAEKNLTTDLAYETPPSARQELQTPIAQQLQQQQAQSKPDGDE
jgi:hypothetical protein